MSSIAGIDFSTHTVDVVLLDEDQDTATFTRRPIGARSSMQAARNVRDAMPARGAWRDEVIAIGIERPFGHPAAVTALMRVQGAVLACIPPDIPIYEFGPADWKKRFTGRGDATKEEVRELARRFFKPGERLRLDTTDALGVAVAARQIHDEKTARKEAA